MASTGQPPPRAQGQRLAWAQLPAHIRDAIEDWLGEPVVTAQSMAGGFSPGLASRLTTRPGRRVFAKAVSNTLNPMSPTLHRREIRVASRLPSGAPAPRLLWSSQEDDGEEWVVLVFEDVQGRPPAQPWDPAELDDVVDALNRLSAELTPSPIATSEIDDILTFGPLVRGNWSYLKYDNLPRIDPWVNRNLDRMIEAEQRVGEVIAGDTLLHLDLRGDNMLLTDDGVVIVDWPHARVGAAWIDPIGFAPSVAMEGGPEPEDLIARLDATQSADPEHVTLGIIEIAGFFTHQGALPPVEGLPGLRAFQEAQGAVARRWVAQRTGWE
ncbi:MAG: aminoglycoside phosphotransferase family protein [Chloroflexia bacterium]|nr:aminoglycoside phosphotransferase family protein [Chloroflexia bacterium]